MSGSVFIKKVARFFYNFSSYGLGFFSLVAVLQACDTQLPIGLDFVEREPLHVFNIDTVTIAFSTVYLDCLATNNSGRLLAGYHHDSTLGAVELKSYFLIGNDSLLTTPGENYPLILL